jgi:hypothetical protein
MITKGIFNHILRLLLVGIIISFSFNVSLADNNKQTEDCMEKAIEKIIEIRSLPEKKYLNTLDNQNVSLHEFNDKCLKLFPNCSLFEKFYYLPNEIREIASKTKRGVKKHKIRCYSNCLSVFCSEKYDPQKTHGDIAEFYDEKGKFMGLSVYMGEGKYCPLPYDGYQTQSSK